MSSCVLLTRRLLVTPLVQYVGWPHLHEHDLLCQCVAAVNAWGSCGNATCSCRAVFLSQVEQSRLDAERLSEELGGERKDLRAWEERLRERKAQLERERAAVEGEAKRLVEGRIRLCACVA